MSMINLPISLEVIREFAVEFHFKEIESETPGCYSFVKTVAKGRIRINYHEPPINIMLLAITKDKKGFKPFHKAFPAHKYQLVYELFHRSTSFIK